MAKDISLFMSDDQELYAMYGLISLDWWVGLLKLRSLISPQGKFSILRKYRLAELSNVSHLHTKLCLYPTYITIQQLGMLTLTLSDVLLRFSSNELYISTA